MSIYENSKGASNKKSSHPQAAKTKNIRNDKDLTALVKQMKKGPKTAKEILFDSDKSILGVLQRDGEPYMFSDAELKEFLKLQG